jgi:hypothetical protein
MIGLITNGPMLLQWNSTHDVNSATALEFRFPPLFRRQSNCTSQGHSSCPIEPTVQSAALC